MAEEVGAEEVGAEEVGAEEVGAEEVGVEDLERFAPGQSIAGGAWRQERRSTLAPLTTVRVSGHTARVFIVVVKLPTA
jgi:hypothetical protein